MKQERKSNFELLRIVAMLIILISHFNIHGQFEMTKTDCIFNEVFVKIFVFGAIANHIYILITGYFMIDSKHSFKKVILLTLKMLFYSIIIPVVLLVLGYSKLGLIDALKMIFPIFFGNWFCIYYIILYCFIPFINKLIRVLDKKELKTLIITALIVVSIVPNISFNAWKFSALAVFILDYLIGAYVKLYYTNKRNLTKYIKILTVALLIMISSIFAIEHIGHTLNNETIINNSRYFVTSNNSAMGILVAFCLFMIFKDLMISNKAINYIASSTLGVYLIHENSYLRDILWNKLLPNASFYNSPCFIVIAVFKICVVFCICVIIDKFRDFLLSKTEDKIAKKICYLKIGENCNEQI